MLFFLRPVMLLLLLCVCLAAGAANEWRDPDRAVPEQPAPPPVRKAPLPPPAPAPVTAPPAVTPPLVEGELALQVQRVCNYQNAYEDKGSGGKIDGAFYLPLAAPGFFIIGGYAQGNYDAPADCVSAVKPVNAASAALLQAPRNWERRWTDKGSGASKDGSIWHPSSPAADYVCIGSVAHQGYQQPAPGNYRCVHACLLENVPAAAPLWSTAGTGAKQEIYVYKLHNSNSFFATPDNDRPPTLQDLKGNTSCRF